MLPLHPLRTQVRPRTRRPRRGDPPQRGPQHQNRRSRPRRFEPLTTSEARQLLATTQGHRLHGLFDLALPTGLRKGELLGLRWEDLDLDSGTAVIRRTLQRTRTAGLTALPTKTRASERRIDLPAECLRTLEHHQRRQHHERQISAGKWTETGYVFTTPHGTPIEPSNLTRAFNTLLDKAGLRRIRFHDIRHTTAP